MLLGQCFMPGTISEVQALKKNHFPFCVRHILLCGIFSQKGIPGMIFRSAQPALSLSFRGCGFVPPAQKIIRSLSKRVRAPEFLPATSQLCITSNVYMDALSIILDITIRCV